MCSEFFSIRVIVDYLKMDFDMSNDKTYQGAKEKIVSGISHWEKIGSERYLEDIIPLDRSLSEKQNLTYAYKAFNIPVDAASRAELICAGLKCTPDTLFMASLFVSLYKYSRSDRISLILLFEADKGNHSEVCLPLRIPITLNNINDNSIINELLENIRIDTDLVRNSVDEKFEELEKISKCISDSYIDKHANYGFLYRNIGERSKFDKCGHRKEDSTEGFCVDERLRIEINRSDCACNCIVAYRSDLFDERSIERFIDLYVSVFSETTHHADSTIRSIHCLTDRQKIELERLKSNKIIKIDEIVFSKLFESRAEINPEKIALKYGNEKISYTELNRRSNALARVLRNRNIGPDNIVGLVLDRSIGCFTIILAVLKAGAAFCPVDTEQPILRIRDICDQELFDLVIAENQFIDIAVDVLSYSDLVEESKIESGENLRLKFDIKHLMYVIHTSGTTGKPKAVGVEHEQFMNYLHARIDMVGSLESANFAMISTFAADLGHTAIFPTLSQGGTVHIIEKRLFHDAIGLSEYFVKNNVDCLKIVTSHFQALLNATKSSNIIPPKLIIIGGVPCTWDFVEEVHRRRPGLTLINSFGHTETAVGATAFITPTSRGHDKSTFIPIGVPLANVEVYILDENLEQLPLGAIGEIHIGGPRLARGYLNSPRQTAEKFINSPFSSVSNAKLYRTGDWGRLRYDGNIEFCSRRDDQLKLRGFRVELCEIEIEIEKIRGVKKAVVLPNKNMLGDTYLSAYIVDELGNIGSRIKELKTALKERLPDYMIPASYGFLKSIPLDLNGKINRKKLLEFPTKTRDQQVYVREYAETAVQLILKEMWESILQVDMGISDNFFESGGDSLRVIQMIAKVKRNNNLVAIKRITVSEVIDNPTIKAFSGLFVNSDIEATVQI